MWVCGCVGERTEYEYEYDYACEPANSPKHPNTHTVLRFNRRLRRTELPPLTVFAAHPPGHYHGFEKYFA